MLIAIQLTKSFLATHPLPILSLHHLMFLFLVSLTGGLTYLAAIFVIDRPSSLEVTRLLLKLEKV